MDLFEFVTENALVLMPVLYVMGLFMKNTPAVPDWVIPWVLLIAGMVGGCFVVEMGVEGVMQGIFVSGATVMANQLVKQTVEKG